MVRNFPCACTHCNVFCEKWPQQKNSIRQLLYSYAHFASYVLMYILFRVSSRTCRQSLAVTSVLASMVGLELISMSHGLNSSQIMKSAPYNSKQFWGKEMKVQVRNKRKSLSLFLDPHRLQSREVEFRIRIIFKLFHVQCTLVHAQNFEQQWIDSILVVWCTFFFLFHPIPPIVVGQWLQSLQKLWWLGGEIITVCDQCQKHIHSAPRYLALAYTLYSSLAFLCAAC